MKRIGLALALLTAVGLSHAADVPFGGKDFYPSPERPVGFRGDGNGYYPGATVVTKFQTGTPQAIPNPNTGPNQPKEVIQPGDDNQINIVWKTQMPGWANTHPIVVGDRVFTHAEPNQLVCVDAHTGKVLWTRATNVYATEARDPKVAEQLNRLRQVYHVTADFIRGVTTNPPPGRFKDYGDLCGLFADKTVPRLLEELKQVDPQGNYADAAAQTAAACKNAATAYHSGAQNKDQRKPPFNADDLGPLAKAVRDRLLALTGEKDAKASRKMLDIPWGNMVGWMMSVPVSDGRFIYTSLGQGATACYDLNGELIWVRRMPEADGGRTISIQSPLLVDGVLVDMHQGGKELIALDAKTGKEVWRAPTKGDYKFGTRGGYYVGSHKVVALTGPDGKPVNVIVTTLCNIIRARDGKPLGAVPFETEGLSGGPSIMASGDIIMKGANGDGFSVPYIAYRLAFEGPDKVVGKELWRLPKTPEYNGWIATPQAFIVAGVAYEPATGKVLFDLGRGAGRGLSNLVLGQTLFLHQPSRWDGPVNGKVATLFTTYDLSTFSKPVRISDKSILGGAPKPKYVEYDELAPELMAHPGFINCWGARPGHNLHVDTAAVACGNRLFIRTTADLYCIGDPAAKYDWNPTSRPKDVADALKPSR